MITQPSRPLNRNYGINIVTKFLLTPLLLTAIFFLNPLAQPTGLQAAPTTTHERSGTPISYLRARISPQAVTPLELRISIHNVKYYPERNVYEVSLGITDPGTLSRVIVKLRDKRQGVEVGSDHIFTNLEEIMLVEVDGANLQGGREYTIQVLAADRQGYLIYRQTNSTDAVSEILAERDVTHAEQPTPPPPSVAIESVNPTLIWTPQGRLEGSLFIRINYPADAPLDRYRIVIIENELNREVYSEPMQLLHGQSVVEMPLPETMLIPAPVEYSLRIYFGLSDGSSLAEPAVVNFTAVPPAPPSRTEIIWRTVRDQTWAQATIVAILLSCAGWVLLPLLRRKKEPELRPLPVERTHVELGNSPAPSAMRLRVKVLHAPQQKQKLDQVVTHFPCEIGRHKNCDVNLSEITPDKRISRHHVRITTENGVLYLKDLDSTSGTFTGNKAIPLTAKMRLTEPTVVRLGPETTLELRPEPA